MLLKEIQSEKNDQWNVIDGETVKSVEGPRDDGQYTIILDHGQFGVKFFWKPDDGVDVQALVGKPITISKAVAKFNDKGYIKWLTSSQHTKVTISNGAFHAQSSSATPPGTGSKSLKDLEAWVEYSFTRWDKKFDAQQHWAFAFSCWIDRLPVPTGDEKPSFDSDSIPF